MKKAMTGFLNPLEILIPQEEIDSPNENGCTPLMLAILAGNAAIVASLIANGANINSKNKFGYSLMSVAAAKGNIKIIRLLLEAGVKPKNESLLSKGTSQGLSPILAAAANGHEEVVKLLIDKGFPLNEAAPISGASALHLAVSGLHEDCVGVLVTRGANVNARDAAGYTALDLITLHPWREKQNQEQINNMLSALQASTCLLRPGWKEDMLKCAQGDDVEKMARLLTELRVFKENLKVKENYENLYIPTISTALINAVIHGNIQMCSQLLNNGAAIDIMTEDGMTPLMLAAKHGHMSVTRLLLDSGANVHLRYFSTGHNAFEIASLEDNTSNELLRLLAQRTLRPHLTLSPCPKIPSYPQPLSPYNFQSPRSSAESLQSSSQQSHSALTPQPSKRSFLFPSPMKKKKGSSSLPGSPLYQNSVLKTSWPYSPRKVNKTDLKKVTKVSENSELDSILDSRTTNKMKLWMKCVSDKFKN